jgi:dihydrofolate reductase (EC 1.5.1.3)
MNDRDLTSYLDMSRIENLSLVVAMAKNRAIGYRNRLPWHIPEDLQRFKQLTTGHTIIMGRKTFESLPNGPLPHRTNVIITRSPRAISGCEVYDSLDEALWAHRDEEEVFVIGGASVYAQALPWANRLYLTLVDGIPAQADSFFPKIDLDRWTLTKKEKHQGFSFIEYIAK